jgi:hypothetical protein
MEAKTTITIFSPRDFRQRLIVAVLLLFMFGAESAKFRPAALYRLIMLFNFDGTCVLRACLMPDMGKSLSSKFIPLFAF